MEVCATDSSWVNPFNPYFPAAPPLFANRRRELGFYREGLAQGLHPRGPGPWNVALLGPWGIGKTSLLRQFALLTNDATPPALSVVVTITSGMKGLEGLTADLLSRIGAALSGHLEWPDVLRRELNRWQPAIQMGPLRASRTSQDPAVSGGSLLFRELDRLWREYLVGRVGGVVILLDDAQQLLAHDPSALLTLRAVFQDLQGTGARYPLVITGPDTLFQAVQDLSEPVTRFFERMALGPFSLEDTAEAVRGPLEVAQVPLDLDAEAVSALWHVTTGHPFFTSFAMRDIVRREADPSHRRQLSASHIRAAWPDIAAHLAEERFAAEWGGCTPAERDLLKSLATSNSSSVSFGERSRGTLLARLVKKGLVHRKARGVYSLYHPLFASFVQGRTDR